MTAVGVPRLVLGDRSTPVVAESWRDDAACKGATDFFYPEKGHAHGAQAAAIRATCAECPVLAECREDALTTPYEVYGWQAGMSPVELRLARHGVPKRRGPVAPCGTSAAYKRHRRNGEDACDACKAANAAYHRRRGAS